MAWAALPTLRPLTAAACRRSNRHRSRMHGCIYRRPPASSCLLQLRQQRAMQDQAAAEAAAQAAQTLLAQVLAAAVHVEGSGPAPMQE